MNNQTLSTSTHVRRRNRRGISILEVLFSIGIATIGLFGVLALIPFAVHQANVGLDIERGMTTGRNAMAEFKIRGYLDPNRWYYEDDAATPLLIEPRNSYVIDPEFIAHYTTVAGQWPYGTGRDNFPSVEQHAEFEMNFTDLFPPGSEVDIGLNSRPFIDRVTLHTGGTPMSKALAKQVVVASDDIIYKFREDATTLEDEFAPPKAEYIMIEESPGSGNMIPAKRQTQGLFSWMAFVRPENNPFPNSVTRHYALDLVVIQQRAGLGNDMQSPGVVDDDWYDRVFEVDPASFINNQMFNGGEIRLAREIRAPSVVTANNPRDPDALEIKNGDWIMLTNKSIGYRWYQVSNVDPIEENVNLDLQQETWRMTIQGPSFQMSAGDTTYAIHIPNVVNVFSKTFVTELGTAWKQ